MSADPCDVPPKVLIAIVARLEVRRRDRVAVLAGDGIEQRLLDQRVHRDAVVVRLLCRDLRVVLELGGDAVVLVELHELVAAFVVIEPVRKVMAVDPGRGLQIRVVVAVRTRPDHQPDGTAEQHREDDDDDRLLTALTLPAGLPLALGQAGLVGSDVPRDLP